MMTVLCYPQPGKVKSRVVLDAFAKGCGGGIAPFSVLSADKRPVAFFGLVGIEGLMRQAIAEGRDWYYGDNAYFDVTRGRFYRFTRSWFQSVKPRIAPDYAKLKLFDLEPKPWQRDGKHIVVVEQSEHFLGLSGARRGWLLDVAAQLKGATDRPVRIRKWSRDKSKAASSLQADLRGAWALVTHMSAAANEALIAGIPVFVSGACAATPMASGALTNIERPNYPDGREEWAARLLASQWTIDELRAGIAWRKLSG